MFTHLLLVNSGEVLKLTEHEASILNELINGNVIRELRYGQ